jgi:serine/threonine protein kinase
VDSADEVVWELPGYVLLERIALGGRGEVYLAREGGDQGPLVAVKVLRPEDANRKDRVVAFLDEARISSLLVHPNIVRVYHGDIHQGLPYLVMEHVDGLTLWDLNERARMVNQTIPADLAAYMVAKVAEALAYAHELTDSQGRPLNLVHRDVSAVNVMATFDGAIKLLDFGIARSTLRSQHTAPGIIKGKLDYLSPEQCEGGTIEAVTDIYSLGVLLFELVTGTRPFYETDVARLFKLVARGDRPRVRDINPDVPPRVEQIIDRAMATKKRQRHQSARLMLDDLQSYLTTLPSPPTSSSVARVMAELAPDKVTNIADTYGPSETTTVQRMSLPDPPSLDPEGELQAAPTVADFKYSATTLRSFTDDVDNERTQIDGKVPSPPSVAVAPDAYEPSLETERGRYSMPDTVVEESPLRRAVSGIQPPASRSRLVLLVIAMVALFSLAILAGIAVTLWLRGERSPTVSPQQQQLIESGGAQAQPDATTPPPPIAPPVATTGRLEVRVAPAGAVVSAGDAPPQLATAGVATFALAPGTHALLVTAPDGRRETRSVVIQAGETSMVDLDLTTSTRGRLTVRSRRRAMVYLDQTKLGVTPVERHEVEPGDYTVKLASRHGVRRQQIKILPGAEEDIFIDF